MPMPLKILSAFLLASASVASAIAAQQAGRSVVQRGTVTRDLYLGGGTVDVDANVLGDVVVAGGQIRIAQRVEGDIIAAGGTVELAAVVLDDVRAAGGTVTLRGPVAGDVIAAGGRVTVAPEGRVGGRTWLSGGDVEVAGTLDAGLRAAGGEIVLSGHITGDADLVADRVTVASTAVITGNLTYRSPREAMIVPGATIGGQVIHHPAPRRALAGTLVGTLIVLAALGLLGAALLAAFPGFAAGTMHTLQRAPWPSLGVGAGVLVGLPVLALVLAITVVGLAAAGVVVAVYLVALVLGWLAGALKVGELLYRALRATPGSSTGSWALMLLSGLFIAAVVGMIPILGGLSRLAVLLLGLGALALHGFGAWRAWRAGAGSLAGTT